MRRLAVVLVGVAGLALSCAAIAQERRFDVVVRPGDARHDAVHKIRVSKVAFGGSRIIVWSGASIDPDCSEHPGYTLSVVEPPSHGEVNVVAEPMYLAFPPNNPRSACNRRKVPAKQAYYTASPGYSGHDRLVLEGMTEDGTLRHVTVDVDVRKGAAG